MSERETIPPLRELGAELRRVAAFEHEQPSAGFATRLSALFDYPGAARRAAALAVAGVLALGGIAYAIPATRNAVDQVTGWIAQDDLTPSRIAVPTDPPVVDGSFDGAEGEEAAKRIDSAFAGIAEAIEEGLEPLVLYVHPRNALETVGEVEGLARLCGVTSEKTIEQTIAYARDLAQFEDFDWTCERAMALLLRNAKINKGLKRISRSKVVGVNINGDAGTATIDRGRDVPLATVPLVKEDGTWKIGTSPIGEAGGL